jgi:predicted outer membrane protein
MTIFVLPALLLASVVNAQNPQAERRDGSAAKDSQMDRQLASCLAIDNWAEVEIAKFAETKSQSDDVKQFAQMLQQEHTQILNKLQQAEPSVARFVTAGRTARADAAAPARTDATAPATRPAGRDHDPAVAGGGDKMLQIKQEIAETCVNTFREELSKKQKTDFDRCFIGYQVGAHLHMLDTLKVFERHASPELAQTIADAKQSTQEHLTQAKQMLERLEAKVARVERASSTELK